MSKHFLTAAALVILSSCSGGSLTLLVGTYTDAGSRGIYTYSFNPSTGGSTQLSSAEAGNPSFLTLSPDGGTVYAVSEYNNAGAAVYTFDFDKGTGTLAERSRVLTGGGDPCYIATDGKLLATANYSGGSMTVFPIGKDGLPGEGTVFAGGTGGPDMSRQARPHVHCSVFSPDGKYIFASDFSADRLVRFDISEDGGVEPSGITTALEPDYGPRHLVFNRKGDMAYVIGELSGTVTAMSYSDGVLTPLQVIDADSFDARGSADIHLSPDGKFLYVSNRLKGDGITWFKVTKDGLLEEAGYQATGVHPRNFGITPDGRYLLCACRDSDKIQVFRRDSRTGALADTGKDILLSHPVCVQFAQ